jgi:hypothetical protein
VISTHSIARCGQLANITRIVKNFHVPQHVIKNNTLARFVVLFSHNILVYSITTTYDLHPCCTLHNSSSCDDRRDNDSDGRASPSPTERQIFERARVVGITCATSKLFLDNGLNTANKFGNFQIVLFDNSTHVTEHDGMSPNMCCCGQRW